MSRNGESPRDKDYHRNGNSYWTVTVLGMVTILGMVPILGMVIVQGMGNIIAMVGVDNMTPYIFSNIIWSSNLEFGTDKQTDKQTDNTILELLRN